MAEQEMTVKQTAALEKTNDREPVIRVRHVSKKYYIGQYTGGHFLDELKRKKGKKEASGAAKQSEIYALDDVSFEVFQGEAFGIIGLNGAGKSTLLKILCEITAPTSGEIDIYGRIASILEVGTGFNSEMTGRENVYLNGAILGMTKQEIDRKMDQIVEFSEIGEFIDTPVKRYSSGMYTRLAFSVAAHLDNEIMIMDEVMAVGDVGFREKCLQQMKRKADAGRTILYVGHNMSYVKKLCDRCIVLDKGKLLFMGDTEDAVQFYLDKIESRMKPETQNGQQDQTGQNGQNGKKPKVPKAAFLGPRRDVRDKERSALLTDHRIHLDEMWYVDRDSILFTPEAPAVMTLNWAVLEDYQDLCLRLEVWTADDEHQASYVLYGIGDGKAGERKSLTLKVDISCFTPGTYKFKHTFFFRNGPDSVINTERVIGLSFTMLPKDNEYWEPRKMSHVRLEGIEIISAPQRAAYAPAAPRGG